MDALNYIINKYSLDVNVKQPVNIPDMTRVDLANLFFELGYKRGAEIGVERAKYSEVLCRANPNALIYGIDPWQICKGYREHVSQDKLDGFYKATQECMSDYKYAIIRGFSMEVVKRFSDDNLDFVYIDGNHDFQNVANDIVEWSRKVRLGGIVSGHDYRRFKKQSYTCHVKDVVQAYAYSHHIRPWFVLRGDRAASWMWVKE